MTLLKLKVAHTNNTLDIILKVSDIKCAWVSKVLLYTRVNTLYFIFHMKQLLVLLIISIDLNMYS